MPKPRKSPTRSPDSAYEGIVRAIGRPILKKLRSYDRKKPPKKASK